jgi:repressor LexA
MKTSLGERLKKAREKRRFSQLEVAKKLGISNGTLSGYERNYRDPDTEMLQKLADFYEVTTDYLLGRDNSLQEAKERSNSIIQKYLSMYKTDDETKKIDLVKIPIIGEIKAGYDFIAEQNIIGYELVSKNDVADGQYFYLIVKGDSMIDEGIKEGFRVLVRSQDFVEEGKIGVILVNGDEATLKRVYYQEDKIILQASNRNIPPRILPAEDVRIQGQVMKVEFDV